LSVLIVDDDPLSAKLVAVVLRGEGCEVRIAGSAEEALGIVEEMRPRAVILDLILPRMGGVLLAERLRANRGTKSTLLVAVTAFDGPETERVARSAGCDLFLRKPIDALALPELLADHLGDRP
jgi:CheY-like chemotaxis protein